MRHAWIEDSVKVFFLEKKSSMWRTGCATLSVLILEIQNEDNLEPLHVCQ